MHVALLRGINVGGHRRLPMADLTAIFRGAGCAEVRSYIQSGNVVFRAPPALAARIPGLVSDAIEADFGYDVPVVSRSAAELEAAARANPFLTAPLDRDADHSAAYVVFLERAPGAARIASLDPDRSPPDRFHVSGAEIYLLLAAGAGKTRLGNDYFESKLGVAATTRNWRTTLTLLDWIRA